MVGLHLTEYFRVRTVIQQLLLLDASEVHAELKDYDGRTQLPQAAVNGHEGVVKLLLDTDKVDVNSKDQDSQTPLFRALENR